VRRDTSNLEAPMQIDFATRERDLLGCWLVSPTDTVRDQACTLCEPDFFLKAHRIIFRRMRAMAEAGKPFDAPTLEEELDQHGDDLASVGGLSYISSLIDGAVERKDISHLVKAIRERALRRRAAKTGEKLQEVAKDPSVSPTALTELAAGFVTDCIEARDESPPQFSEEALALRFSRQYADDMRYVARWGRWLCWNGKRWREDDTLAVFDQARAICRRASTECGDTEKATAMRLTASATVAAVERLARADRRHAATIEQWDVDDWLLNTAGGIVDLHTGEAQPHQREQYVTKLTAAGPDGECPLWLRFLDRITAGNNELQSFLQRMVGYSLTGSTREHALFFLYGTGANGKSVFVTTIAGLLGDYAKTAPTSTFTATNTEQHPTDLAGLRGARFVSATETEDGSRWAESKIKALTGGDTITARFMRCDFFEFKPAFKLLVCGNHKPSLRSVDEAMRRRLHLVPFVVTIPEQERDTSLGQKLKGEYPGILQWAIQGCLAWQREGLNPPDVVRNATAEYLEAEDAVGRWVEDRCITEPRLWTKGSALFSDWQQWCEGSGERPGTRRRFTQALEARGFNQERTPAARGFAGIALRSDTDMTLMTEVPILPVNTRARERSI
jgi:putative DNA primase/helicase